MQSETLKPNILQMLEIGKDCGLDTVQEAYENYSNHYDMFFLISDIRNQTKVFHEELFEIGLLERKDGKMYSIPERSIDEAIEICNSKSK